MKRLNLRLRLLILLALAVRPQFAGAETPLASALPTFHEVLGLVRSNLTGISEAELDRAATAGLIKELNPRVARITNTVTKSSAAGSISKTAIYDSAYGYIRFDQVNSGAAQEFSRVLDTMRSTNTLKGLVLDLRFAEGRDYAAAAGVAERFIDSGEILLKTPEGAINGTTKTNSVKLPVAVLVNKETSGAAEALAALVRQQEIGLVIGARTSGTASGSELFPLSNGEKLRISKGAVQFGNGEAVAPKGVAPDLEVTISAADEKASYDDPFRPQAKLFASSGSASGGTVPPPSRTTRPGSLRNLNEAELVRRHREGLDFEDLDGKVDEDRPLINDPALARGLDLLKGLSVAKQFKRR